MKVAKERKSSVLMSNAIHHRVDSLTGIAALAAIALANVFPSFAGVDALGGLLISWLVVKAGFGNTKTALVELADSSIDADMKSKVRSAAMQAIKDLAEEKVQVRQVQGVKAGQNYLVELEIVVPQDWSVRKTQAIEEAVRKQVGDTVRGVRRVSIRHIAEGSDETNFMDEFVSPSVSIASKPKANEDGNQKQ